MITGTIVPLRNQEPGSFFPSRGFRLDLILVRYLQAEKYRKKYVLKFDTYGMHQKYYNFNVSSSLFFVTLILIDVCNSTKADVKVRTSLSAKKCLSSLKALGRQDFFVDVVDILCHRVDILQ